MTAKTRKWARRVTVFVEAVAWAEILGCVGAVEVNNYSLGSACAIRGRI